MRFATFAPLLSLLAVPSAFAQSAASPASADTREAQTIVGDRSNHRIAISGWFVAPTFGTTSFGGHPAYTPGIRGGLYLNQRVAIGLTANGIGGDDTYVSENDLGNFGSYGGLLLQYVVHSNEIVHASIESTIASGRWCAYTGNDGGRLGCAGKDFLVLEPGANAELNVARHFRIATGIAYRVATAGAGEGPSSLGMSGFVVRAALVFGTF